MNTKNNLRITIAKKTVSYFDDVFVIAEAGVNHNGRLDLAIKLIDAAAKAGADAIKFQTFKASQVVMQTAPMAEYQKRNVAGKHNQIDMLQKLELNEKFYSAIIERCKKKKIIFLSTPHGGFESVDFLNSLRIPAFKFGSGDLNNLPVLAYAAKAGKPMILGTGMSTLPDIKKATNAIIRTGNDKIILLHATTNYPCPPQEVNLRSMTTMANALNYLVGYSDHTMGIETSCAAAALNACVIEKHFTLDRRLKGPDHISSAEPQELATLVKRMKYIKNILGSAVKQPNRSELVMMKTVRKSIVSLQHIKKGNMFTFHNIGIKRPGTGLPPEFFDKIIGKKALRNIHPDTLLSRHDYEA
ncbi:MAG: N-acetylneuraminate synthase [Patescibacteria group bacterium]|jgi:N-acetylneuraminate synthase/N,N'-diacetyllegionaminate synthase